MKESSFVEEMEARFSEYLASDDDQTVMAAQAFIYGCDQYQLADEARTFLKSNKNPTAQELGDFFDRTCPGGLAPGDDGADLLE